MTPALRFWTTLAALDGLAAVAAGAFGAHAAGDPAVRELLRTGAQYQSVHAAAALAAAAFGRGRPGRATAAATWAAGLFAVGGLLFGGSLDVLAVTGVRAWGAVTPVGGLLLMAGWAAAGWAALAASPAPEA